MSKKPYQPEYTDLRSITRHSDRCQTVVILEERYRLKRMKWLELGQCSLSTNDRTGITELSSYMLDATDFEEDSAYAIKLPLIGLRLEHVFYHQSSFTAWVSMEDGEDDFKVPRPGYNPMEHEHAHECEDCEKKHIIVPEGFYVPPFDEELFEAVKGHRVEILLGTKLED